MKILVAADGSDHGAVAADVAQRLFGAGAEYLLLCVTPMPAPLGWAAGWESAAPIGPPLGGAPGDDPLSTTALESLEHEAEQHAATVSARTDIERIEPIGDVGEPAQCILEVAHARCVDLIVIGFHQRSWLRRLLAPSVSRAVMRRSDTPVLVVR